MKKVYFIVIMAAVCVTLLFVSCASSPERKASIKGNPLESLDDLRGRWEASDGTGYEYPFEADGKTYLLVHFKFSDDTAMWQQYAADNKIDINELWDKRYSYISYVYNQKKPQIRADENGTQNGIKLQLDDNGHIIAGEIWLIPEKVLALNLHFFVITRDKTKFIENGEFHLMSSIFSTSLISSEGSVYEKQ